MAYQKVTLKDNLFQKSGRDEKGNYTKWLSVDLINSSGTFIPERGDKKGIEQEYSNDKIRITVSKLHYKDGSVLHTGKLSKDGTPYSVRDEAKIDIDIEQFKEMLFQGNDMLEKI